MSKPEAGEVVHVAAACDENYAMPLAAMLASLESHLDGRDALTVHVLGSGLAAATWQKLRDSVPGERLDWNCIDVDAPALAAGGFGLRAYEHFSAACFFRLLLPELLPRDLDKVLYLDSDLVVLGDIGELWRVNVGDVALAAVAEWDGNAATASSPAGIRLHRELDLRPEQRLFNAGVLMLNLERWRSERVAERAFDYLRVGAGDVRWHEQEALNVVVSGGFLQLEPRWNVPAGAIPAAGGAAILHYLSARKPWHWYFDAAQAAPFFAALDRTQWSGWRPSRPRCAVAKRVASQLGKAASKRVHRVETRLRKSLDGRRYRGACPALSRIDGNRPPPAAGREIRLFLTHPVADPERFARVLGVWFGAGVDRAIVLSESADFAVSPDDDRAGPIHAYRCRAGDAQPALRHLLQRFGRAHRCVLGRGQELLSDIGGAAVDLRQLGREMDADGAGAVEALYEHGDRIELTARDARSGKIFRARAHVRDPAQSYDRPAIVSRLAVLDYADDFLLNEEATLCAGASVSATLLRVREGPGPTAVDLPA